MEDGLWGLFFTLLIGMTATAIQRPVVYRRLSSLIWGCGIGLGVAVIAYGMLLSSFFESLEGVIDRTKMVEAIAIHQGWKPDWKLWASCFWFSIYAMICDWISHRVEHD